MATLLQWVKRNIVKDEIPAPPVDVSPNGRVTGAERLRKLRQELDLQGDSHLFTPVVDIMLGCAFLWEVDSDND